MRRSIAALVNTSFRSVLLLNSSASCSIADGCTSRAIAEQAWYRWCGVVWAVSRRDCPNPQRFSPSLAGRDNQLVADFERSGFAQKLELPFKV